jgi:pyruvate dehydrogenase E2 component (dihydrolipoamide acetyltransferase)
MSKAINMPQVGQDIELARITEWHVKEGDEVKEGDILATVESDKASFEVEASEAGIVLQLLFKEGDEAVVFKPIAYIGQIDEWVHYKDEKISANEEENEKKDEISSVRKGETNPEGLFSSPSARRIARERNLELSEIKGSGPNSRIVKNDVIAYFEQNKSLKMITPVAKKIVEETGTNSGSMQGTGYGGRVMKKDVVSSISPVKSAILKETPGDQVVLFNKTKKRTAERLSFSKLTIPHYYIFSDVDVTNTLKWRKISNTNLGIKISVNDIIIKSTAEALKKFPEMNSWVDDEKILLKPEINIGVAVSTPTGLLVPVIPDTDRLNLIEINNQSRRNTEDARQGIIRIGKPGTFTVSNLGMYGISRFLPIINPPECAILSVGAVEKKVVPRGGEIIIIDSLTLGLACDHRAVDGAKASEFLSCLKEIIENFSN